MTVEMTDVKASYSAGVMVACLVCPMAGKMVGQMGAQ
jgi:hypothetical protein